MIHETTTTRLGNVYSATLDTLTHKVTITPPVGHDIVAYWDGMIIGATVDLMVPAIVLEAFDYAFDRMILDSNEQAIEGFKVKP